MVEPCTEKPPPVLFATPSFPRPCERCACFLGPYFGEGDNSFVGYPEWPTVGQKSTPRRRYKT